MSVLSNTVRKYLLSNTPYPYNTSHQGGKGKGKFGKSRDGKVKGRKDPSPSSSSVSDVSDGEFWMLPYPEAVNQEDGSYIILGHDNLKVRVTKENWDTLRFNTKTLNPDYFPGSYLAPVPTGPSLDNLQLNATFPRSNICVSS